MKAIIETERLIIRELLPEDKEGMFLLDSNAEVHKYIGTKPVTTIQQSIDVIAFVRQQYTDHGIGRWAMLEKSTNEFIGWIGFKLMKTPVNKHVDFIDFGYRLRQEYWNMGFATEGSEGCLKYGLNTLQLTDIYAMTDLNNGASRRVLEKVGFSLIEVFEYDAEPNWRKPNELTTWYQHKGTTAQNSSKKTMIK